MQRGGLHRDPLSRQKKFPHVGEKSLLVHFKIAAHAPNKYRASSKQTKTFKCGHILFCKEI
jgi:hypothetical protein